jgi:hypothetical protein
MIKTNHKTSKTMKEINHDASMEKLRIQDYVPKWNKFHGSKYTGVIGTLTNRSLCWFYFNTQVMIVSQSWTVAPISRWREFFVDQDMESGIFTVKSYSSRFNWIVNVH